jgi:hypothetical protein
VVVSSRRKVGGPEGVWGAEDPGPVVELEESQESSTPTRASAIKHRKTGDDCKNGSFQDWG